MTGLTVGVRFVRQILPAGDCRCIKKNGDGSIDTKFRTAKADAAGLSRADGLYGVLFGCNFRCPFCHNAPKLLTAADEDGTDEDESLAFLKTAGARRCCRYRRRAAFAPGASALLEKIMRAGLCDQAGHERRVSGAAGGSCACRAGRLRCHGRQNSPARYAKAAGAVELTLSPIDKSVSFLLHDTVDYEFRTTAVAELTMMHHLYSWETGSCRRKAVFISSASSRAIRSCGAGLSAPSEMQLHCWAELVRPKIPAVEIRGI